MVSHLDSSLVLIYSPFCVLSSGSGIDVGKIVFGWESSKEEAQSSGARQRRGKSLLLGAESEYSADLNWSEGLTRNERKVKRSLRPDCFHRAESHSGR